jgi:hypothetical protein
VIVENLPDGRGAGLAGTVADAHHLGADHAGRGATAAKRALYPNYGVSKVPDRSGRSEDYRSTRRPLPVSGGCALASPGSRRFEVVLEKHAPRVSTSKEPRMKLKQIGRAVLFRSNARNRRRDIASLLFMMGIFGCHFAVGGLWTVCVVREVLDAGDS